MRIARQFVLSMFAVSMFAACGGDDGDGGTPDAPPIVVDAPMIDAPAMLMGLGQRCSASMPCPTSAPNCLSTAGATVGFCSQVCVTGGSATSSATGTLPLASITPAPNNAACTAAFSGTVGTAICALRTAITPNDNPLVANKAYTGIELHCAIACGTGNTCPTGLTCSMGGCFPM